MSDTEAAGGTAGPKGPGGTDAAEGKIPFMQRLLDNPFMLLFLGVVIPTVFYLIWGILEVAQIPIAQ
jgi:hypothetical protein